MPLLLGIWIPSGFLWTWLHTPLKLMWPFVQKNYINITWAFLLACSHVGFHMCLSINGSYFSNF
jgi:hypothetical protein